MNGLSQVKKSTWIIVPASDIVYRCGQPVANARETLSIWPQKQEFLKKRVGQNGHQLVRQLNLFEVLGEEFWAVNLLKGD